MDALKFKKKQRVIWFRNGIEDGETEYLPEEEIYVDILCKEENLPRHQRDPIYIYTVRNQRGQTGVVFAYLDQPICVRETQKEESSMAA